MLEAIAPGVWVARAALYATTTTVVAHDGGALLIDPGITTAEVEALAAEIRARGWTVRAGFSTHPHWDHLLWPTALADVPHWARPAAAAHARHGHAALVREWRREVAEPETSGVVLARPLLLPDDGAVPGFSGAVVVSHDAHAPGHAAILLPESRVLVAGDMLSEFEVPLLDLAAADPLGDYAAGLDRLAGLLDDVDIVVPGHGAPAGRPEARRRLDLDRAYLDDLVAGRPSRDPRLGSGAPAWLVAEHEAQVRALPGLGAR